jgi:hypothetical protein
VKKLILKVDDEKLVKIRNKLSVAVQGPKVEFVVNDEYDEDLKLCVYTEHPYGLPKHFDGFPVVWERPCEAEL